MILSSEASYMLASTSADTIVESASVIRNFQLSLLPGSKRSRKVIGLMVNCRLGS
ncbi:hypothetical protein NXX66_20725 [Parabacteroides distasonis]|nr:hypothetical protein NXX66_20725 [Parabacteroides distasonis]